ncbi:hypothetical protein ACMSI6_25035 [Pseudomonas antarctica]
MDKDATAGVGGRVGIQCDQCLCVVGQRLADLPGRARWIDLIFSQW